jgi:glycosyltransferase involved in cell wall biosynthesis
VERHEPAQLAGALERVLIDDALRQRMSERSKHTALRFALPTVAAAYARVFDEVLA